MNILELIPGIGKILDKVITSPAEKAEAQAKLREIDVREIEALSKVQSSWLSNNSIFVSGAIPSLLWMLVLVIFFNFILNPLMGGIFNISLPILDLPEWYSTMCTTIILGLFAKKSYDATDLKVGSLVKKSKFESESDTEHKIEQRERMNKKYNDPPKISPKISDISDNDDIELDEKNDDDDNPPPDYSDPEYINMRWEELLKEKGMK